MAKRNKSLYNQIIGTHLTSAITNGNNSSSSNNSNGQCYRKGNQTQMLPCGWLCKAREQKTAIYQTHSKSIHQFSIATFPALTVVRGARAYPSRLGAKARVASWSQDHVDTNNYTHSCRGKKLLLLVSLTCMSLHCKRKLEYPEKTHTDSWRTRKLHMRHDFPALGSKYTTALIY